MHKIWLSEQEEEDHVRLLAAVPCLNVFLSQYILSKHTLRTLLQLSFDELCNEMATVMTEEQSVMLFHLLHNDEQQELQQQEEENEQMEEPDAQHNDQWIRDLERQSLLVDDENDNAYQQVLYNQQQVQYMVPAPPLQAPLPQQQYHRHLQQPTSSKPNFSHLHHLMSTQQQQQAHFENDLDKASPPTKRRKLNHVAANSQQTGLLLNAHAKASPHGSTQKLDSKTMFDTFKNRSPQGKQFSPGLTMRNQQNGKKRAKR